MVMEKSIMESFKSGITWRSLTALFYSIGIFTPAVIWLNMVTMGVSLGATVEYATLIIFAELCYRSRKPLTKQEAAIIFGPATTVGNIGFLNLIYRSYYTRSPLLSIFNILPEQIPEWWAPPHNSPVFQARTFLHPDWILPIIVFVISQLLLMFHGLSYGLLWREIYIEGERLSFPMQQVTCDVIDTLSTRQESKMKIFSWCAFFSFLYGFMLYTISTYFRVINIEISLIPIPWYDLTSSLELYIPGGAFAIATDAIVLASGMILPIPIVISMFVGSVIRYLVVNPLLVNMGWTLWATRWVPGMKIERIIIDSTLYFWLNPMIGLGFAVGLVPIILHGKSFARSIKAVFQSGKPTSHRICEPTPNLMFISFFLIGTVGPVALFWFLVPDFPLWTLILYVVVFPFLVGSAASRTIGETGAALDVPYLKQLTILASGYPATGQIDAWYLPLGLYAGHGWLRAFKIMELTKTTVKSWITVWLLAYPVTFLLGFLYVSIFWSIAPIPSSLYPIPGITWPLQVIRQSVWITMPKDLFHIDWIIYTFFIFSGLMAIFNYVNIPFSIIGLSVGLGMPIPFAFTRFLGLILRVGLAKIKGNAWEKQNRTTIASGLILGEGLAIVIGVALALAVKSIWIGAF